MIPDLLDKGANVYAKDNRGHTPWDAIVDTKDNFGRTPLDHAFRHGFNDIEEMLREAAAERILRI